MPNAVAPIVSKLLLADAQPAWKVGLDGKQEWGPGGATAPDTTLYRSAANVLQTDDNLRVAQQIVVDLSGAGNGLYFGSSFDTVLYRSAAGDLRTDGVFRAGQHIIVDQVNAGNKLYFGSATDTNLYRGAADTLKTDDSLLVAGAVTVDNGNTVSKLYFSSLQDTSLYRYVANTLKTDGAFHAAGDLSVLLATADTVAQIKLSRNYGGAGMPGLVFGPGGASAQDTALYRSAANELRSIGAIVVGTSLRVDAVGGASKLFFGASDTVANLYRNAAGELRTDGNLRIGSINVISGSGMYGPANMDFRGTNDVYVTTDQMASAVTLRDLSGNYIRLKNTQVEINSVVYARIVFNTDTNLYRSAADTLKTDDNFCFGGHLMINGQVGGAVGGTNFGKLPVYDNNNVLYGYIPIWSS